MRLKLVCAALCALAMLPLGRAQAQSYVRRYADTIKRLNLQLDQRP